MKRIILSLLFLITLTSIAIAKDPFPVADNMECYALVSSTETSKQALAARASNTYRIKWEIRDDNNVDDLYWYDTAFTTTTINTSFSSHTATATAYRIEASSTTPYRDDYPCYQGAIHVMSLTSKTTFYIIEWWR